MISREQLDNWFTYHPPDNQADLDAYEKIRKAGHDFAVAIVEHTPASADQTAAVRKVREAVMTANPVAPPRRQRKQQPWVKRKPNPRPR